LATSGLYYTSSAISVIHISIAGDVKPLQFRVYKAEPSRGHRDDGNFLSVERVCPSQGSVNGVHCPHILCSSYLYVMTLLLKDNGYVSFMYIK